jgi:hypothetical protein
MFPFLGWSLACHQATWKSGGAAPLILNLGTRQRWLVTFMPHLLYPQEKSPEYPFSRRLNGLQSESGDWVVEKIFCSCQEPNRDSPNDLPTGLLLYQLSYHFLALLLKIYLLFHIIGMYVIFYIKPTWCTVFLSLFISFLYMFWVTMCPSSGKITVFMQHLVLVILCGWLSGLQGAPCIPDSHPHRVTSTKCRTDSYFSQRWNIVTRNM